MLARVEGIPENRDMDGIRLRQFLIVCGHKFEQNLGREFIGLPALPDRVLKGPELPEAPCPMNLRASHCTNKT